MNGLFKECLMKRLVAIVGAVVLALAAVGCEREEQPAQPVAYDPELDGAFPGLPALSVDPDFAAVRAAMAEKAAIDTPPADPIEDAKRVVANLFAAAKKGDDDAVIALFDEEEAATSRKLSSIAKNLPSKTATLEQLVQSKLGMEMPKEAKEGAFPHPGMGGEDMLNPLAGAAIQDCKFEQAGNDVLVTGPDGKKLRVVKTGPNWRIQFDAADKKMFAILTDLLTALEKVTDELIAGINNGALTKENFDEEAQKLAKQHMEPAAKKFMEMMAEAMAKGMGGGAPKGATPPAGD